MRSLTQQPPANQPDHAAQGSDIDAEDRSAPVSAARPAASFWDHLGATRGDEYARDDILGGVIPPEVLRPARPAFETVAPDARAQTPERRAAPRDGDAFARAARDRRPGGDDLQRPSQSAPVQRPHAAMDFAAPEARPDTFPPMPGLRAPTGDAADWPLSGNPRPQGRAAPPAAFASAVTADAQARAGSKMRKRRQRRADPAPSRLSYRLNRLWLTPLYHRILTIGLPVFLVALTLAVIMSDPARQEALKAQIEQAKSAFFDRPEFMVHDIRLPNVSPELQQAIRERIEPSLPISSFRLDLDAIRAAVEGLDAVRTADLSLLGDGRLAVSVTERVPVALWRSPDGLELIDIEGHRVGFALSRAARPDLPLIAGEGASSAVAEAIALIDAAGPISRRVVGLVRVGARRWDVMLDRDQRIMLPETRAQVVLERIIALDQAQDLLARDLTVADFRLPARPVLRLGQGALDTIVEIRQ